MRSSFIKTLSIFLRLEKEEIFTSTVIEVITMIACGAAYVAFWYYASIFMGHLYSLPKEDLMPLMMIAGCLYLPAFGVVLAFLWWIADEIVQAVKCDWIKAKQLAAPQF